MDIGRRVGNWKVPIVLEAGDKHRGKGLAVAAIADDPPGFFAGLF